jgi:hypothetical protein
MKKIQCILSVFTFIIIQGTVILANEPDCAVRLYSTRCEIADGKLSETDSILIQINNRNGEEQCDIEIPFDKSEPLIHFSAWIADTNGIIIRELKKQDYKDENETDENSLYADNFVRRFTLKHNVYPYCIGYTFQTVSKHFLSIAHWSPVLKPDIPTSKARLILQCPGDFAVHIFEKNISACHSAEAAGKVVRSWNATYTGSLKREAYCPAMLNFLPFVEIIPLQFTYGISGSTASWRDFGEWQYTLNHGLEVLPPAEKQKIAALTGQIQDKKQLTRILYHYVQDNTRYVSVTLGIGGMKPFPAEYVSTNKYGDCKALSNYMKAILHVAGIDSYYSTVYAGSQPREIIRDLPAQQFNHVVLAVPLDGDTVWLENTSKTNPFGYVGTFIQNRQSLMIDSGNSRLVKIPALHEQDVQVTARMEFFLDFEGHAKTRLHYNFRGEKFEIYNSLYTEFNRDKQNSYIHDHLPFQVFELENWAIVKGDRDDRNIQLESSLVIRNIVKTIGNERYFSVLTADIPEFAAPKYRKLPVQLPYPVYLTDTLIYHLPAAGKIVLPDSSNREGKYGRYHIKYRCMGNTIVVYRDFLLHAGIIPLTEYGDFYSFLSAIKSDEKRKILIQSL